MSKKLKNTINCYSHDGLSNRINCLASAMTTGKKVMYYWSVNKHCPVRFEEIFNTIKNVYVTNDYDREEYPYIVTEAEFSWFFPRNILQLKESTFRYRLFKNYRIIFKKMKITKCVIPPKKSLAISYRHYMKSAEKFDCFIEKILPVIKQVNPKSVFVMSDSLKYRNKICERLSQEGVVFLVNAGSEMKHDLDRSLENIKNFNRDQKSSTYCRLGFICNSSVTTIPQPIQAFGISIYYTYDNWHHTCADLLRDTYDNLNSYKHIDELIKDLRM